MHAIKKFYKLHKITKLMYPAEPSAVSLYFKFNKISNFTTISPYYCQDLCLLCFKKLSYYYILLISQYTVKHCNSSQHCAPQKSKGCFKSARVMIR